MIFRLLLLAIAVLGVEACATAEPSQTRSPRNGWVVLEFDIDPTGSPQHVRAIASMPKGHFEKSAIEAVRGWHYDPKIEDGKPIWRKGVRVRLDFEMED
jgi:TonB family protein